MARVYFQRRGKPAGRKPVKPVVSPAAPRPPVVTRLAGPLADVIAAFQVAAPDTRVELAEIALAAMICSDPEAHHRRILQADLSGLHVTALIRKHLARHIALPTIDTFDRGRGYAGLGTSMDPATVHSSLGGRHRGAS